MSSIDELVKNREGESNKIEKQVYVFSRISWTLVILGLLSILPGIYKFYSDIINISELGDYLSGVAGTFWNLAGLILIFVAFLGQKEQLMIQNTTAKTQLFENSFYNLISLFNENMLNVGIGSSSTNTFKNIYLELEKIFIDHNLKNENNENSDFIIRKSYHSFYSNNKIELRPFLNTLLQLFDLIDDFDHGNKLRYSDVIRAQLSTYQRILIFYHIHYSSQRSLDKIRKFNRGYKFLRNIEEDFFLDPHHYKLYLKELDFIKSPTLRLEKD